MYKEKIICAMYFFSEHVALTVQVLATYLICRGDGMSIKNKSEWFVGSIVISFASGIGLGVLGAPLWLIAVVAGGLSFAYSEDVGKTVYSLFGIK